MSTQRQSGVGLSLIALASASFSVPAVPNPIDAGPAAHLDAAYGKLPLGFEANHGQADSQVRFLSRGPGYTLFLTPNEAVLRLSKPAASGESGVTSRFDSRHPAIARRAAGKMPRGFAAHWPKSGEWGQGTSRAIAELVLPHTDLLFGGYPCPGATDGFLAFPQRCKSAQEQPPTGTVLRMSLKGAKPEPTIAGKDRLPGTTNYLVGKDPRGWRTGIETYAKVAYTQVYPGIDLVYYGNQRQLEHDFIVAPGADPAHVQLAFDGAKSISIDAGGNLIIDTGEGQVTMHKPVIYQKVAGIRKPIDGSYAIRDGNRVGFQLAAYDAGRPLAIDPVLVYSTYLGGCSDERSWGIAVDSFGRIYVAGTTGSSDFPTRNAVQPNFHPGLDRYGNLTSDAFVVALAADGRSLRYATYLGGSGEDTGEGFAVDALGQAYVTGYTGSSDFPVVNALQPKLRGGVDSDGYPTVDAFVAALTPDGRVLRYSTYLGGSGDDLGGGIAVDSSGRTYVAGTTRSSDFPTIKPLQPAFAGGYFDAFIAALTSDGKALRYSTYLGGSGIEWGHDIAVDRSGQTLMTGATDSPDFPTVNALQPDFRGGVDSYGNSIFDAYVAALTSDGRALRYSTYLGGYGSDFGSGIAVDNSGRAYVTGETLSSDFPIRNAVQSAPIGDIGDCDTFVAAFTGDGQALRYSTYLGGSDCEGSFDIAVDGSDQANVTGATRSIDFPTLGAPQAVVGGEYDAFVTGFTADGRALSYSTYLGGSEMDSGEGIAVDLRGQVYVTGDTYSSGFPTVSALQPASCSDVWGVCHDAFVTKISAVATPTIPFSSFHVHRLRIDCHHADFSLEAHFSLGKGSNGLNPPRERVTLKVGKVTASIPAGSFRAKRDGRFGYIGRIGKLRIEASIVPQGDRRYEFEAKVHGVNLGNASSRLPVALTIGNDAGKTTTVTPPREHCHHRNESDRQME